MAPTAPYPNTNELAIVIPKIAGTTIAAAENTGILAAARILSDLVSGFVAIPPTNVSFSIL